jgi:dihydroorotase
MNLLIKNCTWINPADPLSGKVVSIRIRNGRVAEFGHNLDPFENEEVLDAGHWLCSPGWIDLKTNTGAPGHPENESLESLFNAATAGGFTRIQIQPNTRPILQSMESVQYYTQLKNRQGIKVLVSAAATQNLEGKKMAEILTLNSAGADSFATVNPILNSGFLARLLQYMQHSGSVLFHSSWDPDLVLDGQIHEGIVSDRRGLTGIPALAEEVMIQRDIDLLKYAGGKLHIPCVSSGKSVQLLRAAKEELPHLSFSIAAHQLAFNHEALDEFDTVHKVFPPYRLEEDRKELIRAVHSGEVDAVVSDHTPLHYDYKDIEFENASFGISSLETTYSTLVRFSPGISKERQVQLLSSGPARILGMEKVVLKKEIPAEFTLFSQEGTWKPGPGAWSSLSRNNPFFGLELKGRVFGIVTESGFHANPNLSQNSK